MLLPHPRTTTTQTQCPADLDITPQQLPFLNRTKYQCVNKDGQQVSAQDFSQNKVYEGYGGASGGAVSGLFSNAACRCDGADGRVLYKRSVGHGCELHLMYRVQVGVGVGVWWK